MDGHNRAIQFFEPCRIAYEITQFDPIPANHELEWFIFVNMSISLPSLHIPNSARFLVQKREPKQAMQQCMQYSHLTRQPIEIIHTSYAALHVGMPIATYWLDTEPIRTRASQEPEILSLMWAVD